VWAAADILGRECLRLEDQLSVFLGRLGHSKDNRFVNNNYRTHCTPFQQIEEESANSVDWVVAEAAGKYFESAWFKNHSQVNIRIVKKTESRPLFLLMISSSLLLD